MENRDEWKYRRVISIVLIFLVILSFELTMGTRGATEIKIWSCDLGWNEMMECKSENIKEEMKLIYTFIYFLLFLWELMK